MIYIYKINDTKGHKGQIVALFHLRLYFLYILIGSACRLWMIKIHEAGNGEQIAIIVHPLLNSYTLLNLENERKILSQRINLCSPVTKYYTTNYSRSEHTLVIFIWCKHYSTSCSYKLYVSLTLWLAIRCQYRSVHMMTFKPPMTPIHSYSNGCYTCKMNHESAITC